MKRDWDLVIQLLEDIEEAPANQAAKLDTAGYEGYDENTVLEHLEMMIDDVGLVVGKTVKWMGGGSRIGTVFTERLSWEAHEFLAEARVPGVWERVKERLPSRAAGASWQILRPLVSQLAKDAVLGGA